MSVLFWWLNNADEIAAEDTPQILALNLLAEANPVDEGEVVTSPEAGVYYNLDIAWGWPAGHVGQSVTTSLSCAGATIDTGYGALYRGHVSLVSGRRLFDMGWTPDNQTVFLLAREFAAGFWRILFPSPGTYTLTLDGVDSQDVTVVGTAAAATSPTITLLYRNPLNRQPSMILGLAFTGTYPSGGLDLTPDQIGLHGVVHSEIADTATSRFRWADSKLRVYTSAGEVSGAISFSTSGLFIGSIG